MMSIHSIYIVSRPNNLDNTIPLYNNTLSNNVSLSVRVVYTLFSCFVYYLVCLIWN